MQEAKLKLDVFVGFPSYGGNGGISSEHPDIREWFCETLIDMRADDRVGNVLTKTIGDTPVTYVRNRFVHLAEQNKCHLLLMVDSDQSPNKHRGEAWFKPFWKEAFNFVYENYHKGPHVVGAPYCGPPNGTENVYVFRWENDGIRGDETQFRLDPYTRNEAAIMSGVQECAALPTGMILYDMRAFDLIRPSGKPKSQVLEEYKRGEIDLKQAEFDLHEGYFYYEWSDSYAHTKASTEDVTNTRDISMCGQVKLGYNPVHCAWDSWIGHWKPWNVGKPMRYGVESIGANFRRVVESGASAYEKIVEIPDIDTKYPIVVASEKVANNAPVVVQPRIVRPRSEWAKIHTTPQPHLEYLSKFVADLAKSLRRAPRVLEVGSWLGESAIAMADAGAVVHCVDTWNGTPGDVTERLADAAGGTQQVFDEFKARVGERLDTSIYPWRRSSLEAASMAWKQFDMIFIDADHSYQAVRDDILAWWKHLRAGGFMLGHDYHTKQYPGVAEAVHSLFSDDVVEEVAQCSEGSLFLVEKWAGICPRPKDGTDTTV